MSKKKKTREEKERANIHIIKEFDRIVKLSDNNEAQTMSSPIEQRLAENQGNLKDKIENQGNQRYLHQKYSQMFHVEHSESNNAENIKNTEYKHISRDIKKCVIFGSALFILIVVLYFIDLKYDFISPLGSKLFSFLLKR